MLSPDAPTFLYRFFDVDEQLLYVGISHLPVGRWGDHKYGKEWWTDVARIDASRFPTRAEAADAERQAIRSESPLHNKLRYEEPAVDVAPEPEPRNPCHDGWHGFAPGFGPHSTCHCGAQFLDDALW